MGTQAIDYTALAKQTPGYLSSTPAPGAVDYTAMARQSPGYMSSTPASAGSAGGVAGAGAYGVPGLPSAPPPATMTPSLLGKDPSPPGVTANLLKGALKSIPGTMAGTARLVDKLPSFLRPDALAGTGGYEDLDAAAETHGTAQAVGKAAGNMAQFMIPGPGEEVAGAKLGTMVPKALSAVRPLVKALPSMAGSGTVNAMQGGTFTGGAVAGAAGSLFGQAAKAWAPSVAESALNVLAPQRMKGRTPGAAILNDTTGFRPSAVMQSAQDAIDGYTHDLHVAAGASQQPFSMAPARLRMSDALDTAQAENAPSLFRDVGKANAQLYNKLNPLTGKLDPASQIPATVKPIDGLMYKRGIGTLIKNWDQSSNPASGAIKGAYGALDDELDRTVPEAAGLNQKISSLIPVVSRAEMKAAAAPTTQQMFHKLAAPTGALVAPIAGGTYGYKEGGAGGAVAGATAGLFAPALLATPTGQMALARGLNSGALPRYLAPLAAGGANQLARGLGLQKGKPTLFGQ